MALDHHITLMRIRSEVESLVELEGHTFDEACHKACAARQAELKERAILLCGRGWCFGDELHE